MSAPEPRLRAIVVGAPETRAALRAALERGLPGTPVAVEAAASISRADTLLRARRPELLAVEVGGDDAAERMAALERLAARAPDLPIVAVYDPLRVPRDSGEARFCLDLVRAGASDLLRLPFSPEDVAAAVRRLRARATATAPARFRGEMIAVVSPKGGVGKSTVAANLAVLLALRHRDDVVLVDAALQSGTAAHLLDLEPERTLADAVEAADRLDDDLLESLLAVHEPSTLRLLATPRDHARAAAVGDDALAGVLTALRERFRYVVVDTFPLVNAVNLAVVDLADRALLVCEATVPTLRETRRYVDLLRAEETDTGRIEVVVNRRAGGGASVHEDLVERALGLPVTASLPDDRRVVVAANEGRAMVLRSPGAPFSRALGGLARRIAGEEAPGGLWARLRALVGAGRRDASGPSRGERTAADAAAERALFEEEEAASPQDPEVARVAP